MDVVPALALPPPHLRFRVAGTVSEEEYLASGRRSSACLLSALRRQGWEMDSLHNILDFGCGCGRTLRWLMSSRSCHWYGTDIDEEAIQWCQWHVPTVSFASNNMLPPTGYADDTFDGIYAISVFTHLHERHHQAWLRELRRITSKGGYVIITTFDASPSLEFTQHQEECYKRQGFFFSPQTIVELHEYYGTCYLSEGYIRATWSQIFDIVEYKPNGLDNQNIVVLQNCKTQ